MKVGIVTVTYNSINVVEGFLKSLFKQTFSNWHLYIYDNNSQDSIDNILERYNQSKVKYVKLEQNYGFAIANNLAIKKAIDDGCDFVLIINNDTLFGPDTLEKLIISLQHHDALVIAPKILCYPLDNIIWYAGGYFDPKQAQKNVFFGADEIGKGQYDIAKWVDCAPMCCVLIDVKIFASLGYLDENYFIYYEDTDWMYRLKLSGKQLWYEPSIKIYHKVSSLTGGSRSEFTVFHATRGKIYFIKKFYNGWSRKYWLLRYFVSFFIGLLIKRYTFSEFKIKLKSFFSAAILSK